MMDLLHVAYISLPVLAALAVVYAVAVGLERMVKHKIKLEKEYAEKLVRDSREDLRKELKK